MVRTVDRVSILAIRQSSITGNLRNNDSPVFVQGMIPSPQRGPILEETAFLGFGSGSILVY